MEQPAGAAPVVLVVEDEVVVAMDLEAQLRAMDYRVCGRADNAEQALDLARRAHPDLILMDIVLRGGGDGIATAEQIRDELHIPVLFLTAFSDDRTVRRAAAAMPYGYLTKPFQARELRAAIEIALRKADVERTLRNNERWLVAVLRGVGDAVIATDGEGRVGLANPAAMSLLGIEALSGRSASEVVHLEDGAGAALALSQHDCVARSGAAILLTSDGGRVPVDFSAGPICDERDHPMGLTLVLHDERERVAAEQRLASSEQRFRSAFDNAPLGLALVDTNNRYVRVNRALCRLLGATPEQLVGAAQDGYGDSGDNAIEREFQQDLASGRSEAVQYERHYRSRDGRSIWALVSSTLLTTDQEPGHFLIQVNDVTDRKRAEEELAHLAHHDALTGVANRAMLDEQVERQLAVARRRGGRLAVAFIDLDFFKHINDSYGHETGDQVLKELATRLSTSVRAVDIVGRMGGDEFVVVLSEVSDTRDVLALTDKLRLACAQPLRFNGHEVRIAVSMGVSLFPDDATDFRTLLRYADSALYQAKGEGRNNVQFYRPELTARMELRIRLGAGLRLALERGELEMYYQPIVNLDDGRLAAAEALLRWHHPELGLLMPDVFLPMLEESSMAEAIGAWVIGQACRQAALWNADGQRALRIGVNVTAGQFKSGRLVATVSEALRTSGLAPGLLCIEITEQDQMADTEPMRSTMQGLKALGVLVAIDDFGTGYSSLSYISRLRPDELKVDKSLVSSVDRDPERAGLVVAALAMARSLHLLVVAEGVETEAEQAFLRSHGCDMAQGYLHARPIPAPEFEAWLAAARGGGGGGAGGVDGAVRVLH